MNGIIIQQHCVRSEEIDLYDSMPLASEHIFMNEIFSSNMNEHAWKLFRKLFLIK
jgi:hypothetical protein